MAHARRGRFYTDMTDMTFDYSYLPCSSCVGKNHCEKCGEEIRQSLLGLAGVESVTMDVPHRRLTLLLVETNDDDIIDAAEALGVFL